MTKSQALLMKRGFTLVELLVVVSIIAILLAVGTVSYRDFSRRETVSNIAQQLVGDLRLAQQYALSGYKPEGCDEQLTQYEHRWISGTEYRIVAVCGSDEVIVKTVNLPAGSSIDRFNNPSFLPGNAFGYKPVIGGTTLTGDFVTAVRGQGTSFVQVIRISPSGDISYD